MTRPFHLALLIGLCLARDANSAPPVYQLRAVQDLVGVAPGEALDVRVEPQAAAGARALAAEATAGWSLVIAPCAAMDAGAPRLVPQRATGAAFRLTVPAARAARDPYICVARWVDGAVQADPIRLRFCVGDLTLRECHPGWWARHCAGVSAVECDRRAIAAGVKAGDAPSGLIYVERDGERRKVPWTGGSGCPVHTPPWGVVFARKGVVMALDVAERKASPILKPPDGVIYRSPWPDGQGGLMIVSESTTGRRLLRAPSACANAEDCVIEPIRALPSAAGRIVGRSEDALLMTHRLSRHAVRVPLHATQPAEQLTIAAPVGDCAVEVDGARVTNSGAPPTERPLKARP